jgi:acyl-coenzyme A thioesterase PaaI-like protein
MIRLINWWPPLFFAGIRVTHFGQGFREIEVRLKMHFWNRNYVGVHFGGSLYAMTDPFYMLMLMENLGRDYIVWDKGATIRFKRPGKGTVKARFAITEADLDRIRAATADGQKYEPLFTVQVVDESGTVVTEVDKLLYVRRKDAHKSHQAKIARERA